MLNEKKVDMMGFRDTMGHIIEPNVTAWGVLAFQLLLEAGIIRRFAFIFSKGSVVTAS